MTAKRFSMLLAAWLIESLYGDGDPLDTDTAAAVRVWFTGEWAGQSFGYEHSDARRWTEVATSRGNDYDLRFVE